MQVGGALLTVSTDVSTEKTGLNIYTAGVSIQLVFILFFLGLASRFHSKVRKEHEFALRETSWKLLLYGLYTVLSLIAVSPPKSTSNIAIQSWLERPTNLPPRSVSFTVS